MKKQIEGMEKGRLVKMLDGRNVVFIEFGSKWHKGEGETYHLEEGASKTSFKGYLEKEFNNIDNQNPTIYRWKVKDISKVL